MLQFMLDISSDRLAAGIFNPVSKYISRRTGLTVIIAGFEEPLIHFSCIIETEPENDEGHVHALEHLIFNGSMKYPYKDIIHKLAEDVSSWSDIDHTKFHFATTCQKTALAVLPIFLDHVMFPLLSEEDFILDVHHINGDGEDGGLVYEEMKDSYSEPYKNIVTKMAKEMYPNSGYSHDYCGTESALRTSTLSKVKDFHERFYQPENITIIVTGKINHDALFVTLTEFEDEIIAKRNTEHVKQCIKPWQSVSSAPNYGEYNVFHSIKSTEDSENDGYMLIGWLGPVLSNAGAQKELVACEIILDYLTMGPSAPLHTRLVSATEPLAGIVSSNINSSKCSMFRLGIFDIPVKTIEKTRDVALDYIRSGRNGDDFIDMERIRDLVQKEMDNEQVDSELTNRHHEFTMRCLSSLYLETKEFPVVMNPHWPLEELSRETPEYWLKVFRKYFTCDVVVVTSTPIELHKENEEKERLDKQRASLGEQGLAEKAQLFEMAKKFRENSQPTTADLLLMPLSEDLKIALAAAAKNKKIIGTATKDGEHT